MGGTVVRASAPPALAFRLSAVRQVGPSTGAGGLSLQGQRGKATDLVRQRSPRAHSVGVPDAEDSLQTRQQASAGQSATRQRHRHRGVVDSAVCARAPRGCLRPGAPCFCGQRYCISAPSTSPAGRLDVPPARLSPADIDMAGAPSHAGHHHVSDHVSARRRNVIPAAPGLAVQELNQPCFRTSKPLPSSEGKRGRVPREPWDLRAPA